MIRFSIIVPVYNVEEYIEECIESVIHQEFNNYELILVDDGSNDTSGKICDDYEQRYDSIKVIHKPNGGVSSARNEALYVANGEYIIFLDADDILNENCLSIIDELLNKEKIDLLSCNYNIYGQPVNNKEISITKIEKLEDYLIYIYNIPWAVWRNIYNKELLLDNKIRFDEKIAMGEDCLFFMDLFEKSNKKIHCNVDIISYRNKRKGSATNNIKYQAIMDQLNIFSKFFYIYFELNNRKLYELFANKYLNTISTIGNIKNKKELKMIYEHIRKNRIIFKHSNGKKYKLAKIIWFLFGYKLGSKIISF